jgi:hypothetical protein
VVLLLVETTEKAGFLERPALLSDCQNNFPALVIIPSANNHTYAIEEGATHEEI